MRGKFWFPNWQSCLQFSFFWTFLIGHLCLRANDSDKVWWAPTGQRLLLQFSLNSASYKIHLCPDGLSFENNQSRHSHNTTKLSDPRLVPMRSCQSEGNRVPCVPRLWINFVRNSHLRSRHFVITTAQNWPIVLHPPDVHREAQWLWMPFLRNSIRLQRHWVTAGFQHEEDGSTCSVVWEEPVLCNTIRSDSCSFSGLGRRPTDQLTRRQASLHLLDLQPQLWPFTRREVQRKVLTGGSSCQLADGKTEQGKTAIVTFPRKNSWNGQDITNQHALELFRFTTDHPIHPAPVNQWRVPGEAALGSDNDAFVWRRGVSGERGGSRREGWEPVGQSARLTPCVPTTLGPPSPSNTPTFFFTPRTQREKGAAWGKVSSAVVFDYNSHPASITWHQRSRVTGGAAVRCVNTRPLPHPEFSMQRIFPNSRPTAGSYTRGGKLRIPTTRVPTCYIITIRRRRCRVKKGGCLLYGRVFAYVRKDEKIPEENVQVRK